MNFPHEHHYLLEDERITANARKSGWVMALTSLMMVLEIGAGVATHSMALLADGWHMASHAVAMLIALIAYRLGQSRSLNASFSFGSGKLIPLGGYTSALILAMISVLMAIESARRFFRPEMIQFNEAILIAVIGLGVNLASAWILGDHHHEHDLHHEHDHAHEHHDHNLRSAYVHVLADALTSILAIIGLSMGKFYGWIWMDPVMGIVGSAVIWKWAFGLCRDTGGELLDIHSRQIQPASFKSALEAVGGTKVLDLHVWRIAPNAVACNAVIQSRTLRGSDFYRQRLADFQGIKNSIIEERLAEEKSL